MTNEKKHTLTLTGVIIQDKNNAGYTAYFAEFPEAVADGKTEEQATTNLINALKIIFDTRKEDAEDERAQELDTEVTTKKFEFELA